MRALALHDRLVARALPGLASRLDVVHVWPLGALETLRVSRRLGIPTVLERPNAHTAFAYEVVAQECARIGVALPQGHEHAYNAVKLAKEEEEYELADFLLCPSDFVVRTFRDRGFPEHKLIRHTYGYDSARFSPSDTVVRESDGINAAFVGVCAVRKGLHLALEAWLRSPASQTGKLRIAGAFVPDYEAKLAPLLTHPSVEVLGHCNDVPDLMRRSDILLLPSLEEGFGLVCVEAMASGCVPLVSDACTEECVHDRNALVHAAGDSDTLSKHITMLQEQPERLAEMRASCLSDAPSHTWPRAGVRLLAAYEKAMAGSQLWSRDPAPLRTSPT